MTPPDSVTLTIDGRPVTARKGTLLVEAAREAGIEIPVFCYHPKLKPVGACRMCLVQIEKLPRLQTACTTPVAQDMAVHTTGKEVVDAQNGVIELLLANHPLDCPICDKGGECPLQDNAFGWGRGVSRFTEEKRHKEKAYPLSDRIVLDRERCIMCYRCTRFHQEIVGDEALAAIDRGGESEIGTLPGESYDSIFSGNTVELCPVGALTSRQYRFKARPWDLVRTPSVCNGCAVGCNVEVHSRTENVLRLVSRENPAVDGGWLCDRGRFGTLPAPVEQRAVRPLVRESGRLVPTSWETALARARSTLGPDGAVLASPGLSNEALWLLGGFEAAALWPPVGPAWPVQGSIASLPGCKAVVLVGLDAWNELPVLALWIRRAVVENGAKLVVIGPTNGQHRDTAHWLQVAAGQEGETAAALRGALNGEPPAATGPVPADQVQAAARNIQGLAGGVALLVGARVLAAEPGVRAEIEQLAGLLGANGETGLLGAPGLAANARGAQQLAPHLAAADPQALLQSASSLLLIGAEAWATLPARADVRLVVASPTLLDDPRVEVLLPMAHPYERQGTLTNLEGRVQRQAGGASPPPHARADWSLAAALVNALGGEARTRLLDIRSHIAARMPEWAPALLAAEADADEPVPSWEGATSATSPGQGRMPVVAGAERTGNRAP